jgi:hypothetical protein
MASPLRNQAIRQKVGMVSFDYDFMNNAAHAEFMENIETIGIALGEPEKTGVQGAMNIVLANLLLGTLNEC